MEPGATPGSEEVRQSNVGIWGNLMNFAGPAYASVGDFRRVSFRPPLSHATRSTQYVMFTIVGNVHRVLETQILITTFLKSFEFSLPPQNEKTKIHRKLSLVMMLMADGENGAWMGLLIKPISKADVLTSSTRAAIPFIGRPAIFARLKSESDRYRTSIIRSRDERFLRLANQVRFWVLPVNDWRSPMASQPNAVTILGPVDWDLSETWQLLAAKAGSHPISPTASTTL
ncbi:hypothetical protein B0F90DRAFT_1923113 [Multifurca ochricompacta]|uniref:Uncharacterized protein n=1 Tax=Multifurca ochricompacta TaxID=376703 RepID=A0AAD4M9X3_9AGAM|nr:hypothetical protein B0F90DRAFT_1923113 [Multifurca ochricompacta]